MDSSQETPRDPAPAEGAAATDASPAPSSLTTPASGRALRAAAAAASQHWSSLTPGARGRTAPNLTAGDDQGSVTTDGLPDNQTV